MWPFPRRRKPQLGDSQAQPRLSGPKPLTVEYAVVGRNLASGRTLTRVIGTQYDDHWTIGAEAKAIATDTGRVVIEVVERISGGGLPDSTRVLHREEQSDSDREYLGIHMSYLFSARAEAGCRRVHERPAGRELIHEVEDGTLTLRLIEHHFECKSETCDFLYETTHYLQTRPEVLAELSVDPDADDAVVAVASFTHDAQASIAEYERMRRGLDGPARALAVEADESARRLAQIVERVAAEIAAEDASEIRALSA